MIKEKYFVKKLLLITEIYYSIVQNIMVFTMQSLKILNYRNESEIN